MRVLAVLPLVAAYQVQESSTELGTDQSFDGMKATLKGISALQQRGEIDKDTIDTVVDMMNKIESGLKVALTQDVNATQKLLDDAEAAVEACDTTKKNWHNNDFADWNGNVVDGASTDFSDCRADEQLECENATEHCDTYRNQVCGWNTCEKPNADRFTTSDNDDVFEYMCCLESFFSAQSGDYYKNRQNCLDAVTAWNTKSAACDVDQNTYELKFCARESAVEEACKTYRECRNTEQDAYTKVRENVQSLEEIYRAQRVALECLICYGEHILENATDLSDCENPPKCTSLTDCPTIEYEDLTKCMKCIEPNKRVPCTEDFLADQYSQYENTCTPPQECSSCIQRDSSFTQDEGNKTCNAVAKTSYDLAVEQKDGSKDD